MLSKISFNNLNNQVLAGLVQANANPSLIRRLPQQFVLNAVATVTATGGFVQNTIELGGRFVMAPVAFVIPSQKLRATFNKQNLIDATKKVAGFVAAIFTSLLGVIGFSNLNARLQFKFGTSATEPKAQVRQIVELKRRVEALEARPAAAPVDLSEVEGRLAALEGRPAVDLSGVEGRLDALEARPAAAPAAPVDLSGLEGRLDALEGRPAAAPVDLSGVLARLDTLEGRPAAAPVDLSGVEGRLAALEGRSAATPEQLQALEGRVSNLSAGLEEGRVTIEKQAAIIANLQRENTANKEQIANLQRENNAKGDLIASSREDLESLRTLVNRQNVRLEELEPNKIKRVPTLD